MIYIINFDILGTVRNQNLGEEPLFLALKVHLGLVGFDLDQNVTGADFIPNLLVPRSQITGGHCGRQSRHIYAGMWWISYTDRYLD